MKKFLIILVIATTGTQMSNSQDFLTLWNNPNSNFYEIKAAAKEYFKDKDQGVETEYSRYSRWEYFVEGRVYPSGDLSLLNTANVFHDIRLFEEVAPKLKSQPVWEPNGVDKFDNLVGHYSPGIGRIDRVAVDPTDSKIMYIGAPSGDVQAFVDENLKWETEKQLNFGLNAGILNEKVTLTFYKVFMFQYTTCCITYIFSYEMQYRKNLYKVFLD